MFGAIQAYNNKNDCIMEENLRNNNSERIDKRSYIDVIETHSKLKDDLMKDTSEKLH